MTSERAATSLSVRGVEVWWGFFAGLPTHFCARCFHNSLDINLFLISSHCTLHGQHRSHKGSLCILGYLFNVSGLYIFHILSNKFPTVGGSSFQHTNIHTHLVPSKIIATIINALY